MKEIMQETTDNIEQLEENATAEVFGRIDHLDETETKQIAYVAFFEELSYIVHFQFHDSLYSLIKKLSV